MEKKKKKINARGLFDNTKFLLLLSFVLACVFWVAFASASEEESTVSISDVPVTIELPEESSAEGLKVYRGGNEKVTVQIKGNRLTAGSITKNDIQVVGQNTSSINVADTYAISLLAKKVGVKSDYEIVSVTPSVINITVDKEKQQEFTVEKNIDTSEVTLPISSNDTISGYYLAQPVISNDVVTVTGPEQEVKKVSKVQVSDKITGEHSSNITKKLEVKLLDSDGEEVTSDLLNVSPKTVDVTIQILPKKEISVVPTFINVPNGIDVTKIATVKPSKITVAGTEDVLDTLDEIKLDPIDFKTLEPTTTQMTSNISLPKGCVDINNEEQAKISLNLSGYSTTVLNISDFAPVSVPDGYTAEVSTKSISITVAGPTDQIDTITADDIKTTVDLSTLGNGFEGSQEVSVNIEITSSDSCWCINDYTVNVSVKKTS